MGVRSKWGLLQTAPKIIQEDQQRQKILLHLPELLSACPPYALALMQALRLSLLERGRILSVRACMSRKGARFMLPEKWLHNF